MGSTEKRTDAARVCELINKLAISGRRSLFGIAGPPASGKSRLAGEIMQGLVTAKKRAALVPMDGYHLDNSILERSGLSQRKGAPETFDAYGFCEMLIRLADAKRDIFLPTFDRDRDLAIANALLISKDTEIIIVEGNYLLLQQAPWNTLANLWTASIFIDAPSEILRNRLIKRWDGYGFDEKTLQEKINGNDMINARLIRQSSVPASLTLKCTAQADAI